MVLLDENGDHVHAIIKTYLWPKFSDMLEEGKVYTIKNFKLLEVKRSFRPVTHHYMISFLPTTSLKLEQGEFTKIPHHRFEFVAIEDLQSRLNDNTHLTDVIGKVAQIGAVEDQQAKEKILKKRVIQIYGITGRKVQITLWAEKALRIEENLCSDSSKILIIAVTSTTVKMFRENICLSTTAASKIYINPAIPEVDEFMLSSVEELPITERIPKSVEKKTIVEILQMRSESSFEEILVSCNATITAVDSKNGWYYVSCKRCCKKLIKSESTFKCGKCKLDEPFPKLRYKVHVHVEDDTAKTTFVIFDRDAEKLLQMPVSQICNATNMDNEAQGEIPEILNKIVGKTHTFQLKLSRFNLKFGWENFTVTKIANSESIANNSSIVHIIRDEDFDPLTQVQEYSTQAPNEELSTMSQIKKRKDATSTPETNEKQAKKSTIRQIHGKQMTCRNMKKEKMIQGHISFI